MTNCGSCQFYQVDKNNLSQGTCCFNPPQVFLIPDMAGRVNVTSVFPSTKSESSCGQGKPRVNLE